MFFFNAIISTTVCADHPLFLLKS